MNLSLFTTLDIWNILSQYLKPAFVFQKYRNDSREILFINRNKRLSNTQPDESSLLDAYIIDSNSIINFVLESVKSDKSIAGVIVRSVPFLENMIKCLIYTMQHNNKEIDSLLFSGLTLIQYLLAYSEEGTFKQL